MPTASHTSPPNCLPGSAPRQTGGRRFLITEVKTGLETALETEILGHSSVYLQPPGAVEAKDGKNQKVR